MADPKGPEWQWPDPRDRPWWQEARPPAPPAEERTSVPGPSRQRNVRTSRLARGKLPALALAGITGLVGIGVGTGLGPDVANAATSTATVLTGRAAAIKDALAGLVKDGTLTQNQADKVASTLDKALPKGPGRFGHGGPLVGPIRREGREAVAKLLGIPPQQLRTELQGGKSLAQVAQAHGVSRSALLAALVKAEKADLAAAVKAGKLSQAQADRIGQRLQTRISNEVDHVGGPLVGPGRGWGGRGDHDGDGPGGSTTAPAPVPSPTATS